jgi:hypothetical protein
MTPPAHPVAAVTHADPYPYYAELVAHRPLYRDAALDLWVASSADVVTAVMTSERCRVRPAAEPVPRALLGSRSLETVLGERAAEQSRTWARALSGELATCATGSPASRGSFARFWKKFSGTIRRSRTRVASWRAPGAWPDSR